jgi:hypothetical protein
MKKYRTYIIIGIMLTLIALVFLFWDDLKSKFKKSEKITDDSTPINNTALKPKPVNQNISIPEDNKFGIWVKLNFGITGAPILAEYNKQKITEIPNGDFVGEFLGTTPDNKYYRVDYGGSPALVEKVLTNKKPM